MTGLNPTLTYYDNHASEFCERTKEVNMQKSYEPFLPFLRSGAHILDFGCGGGRDAKYFAEKGYNVTGLDGSEELCKAAADYSGQKILHMRFDEITFEQEFDGVWASASLLHLKDTELNDVLEKLVKATKPGGFWFVSFKYGDTEYVDEKTERFFHCENEESFSARIREIDGIALEKIWAEVSYSRGGSEPSWLHAIVRRED